MKIKRSKGEHVFDAINIIFLILFCITIVLPFIQQFNISISGKIEADKVGLHLWTLKPTLSSYQRVFNSGSIMTAYYYTILRCVIGTVLSVIISAMLAYPLSKKYLPGRNFWLWFVVFCMFFSGGLIPTYLVVRDLKLTNTIWSLIIPGLINSFTLLIIKNYFESLPEEIEESAKIDGANEATVFFRIVLPLAKPIIATVALWTIVGHWNSWFDAMIYIQNPKIKVLQGVLRDVIKESTMMEGLGGDSVKGQISQMGRISNYTADSIKAAILMVTTIPVLGIYPFLQKYFVKGIMIGSVKG